MSNTRFKFDKAQYDAIKKACAELLKQTKQMAEGDNNLIAQAAYTYKYAIRSAILTQNFPMAFKPLSRKYSAWKAKVAPNVGLPAFWQLSGSVLQNLTVKKSGGRFLSGLMKSAAHRAEPYRNKRNSKNPNPYSRVVKKTKATDYTVRVNHLRPLFAPVFLEQFPKIRGKIVNHWTARIGMVWR
jgi:hypothetical protein